MKVCLLILVASLASALGATVSELRITEVRPLTDTVEVTHIGAAGFTQGANAFFSFGASSQAIPSGTAWAANEVKQFTVTGLPDTISDLWLYLDNQFTLASSIIHGVKYGGSAITGRESVAVSAAIWPNTGAFAAAPLTGQSLAWDGVGFVEQDWYVDSTPSFGAHPDNVTGTAVNNPFAWPSDAENFETVSAGDPLTSLTAWTFVDGGATANVYTVRGASDTYTGAGTPSATSNRWLRVNDANNVDQNRFYSPTVTAPTNPSSYSWTWYACFEAPIASAANFPRMVIQHMDGAAFQNAWGIEFTNTAINLVVISPTGAAVNSTTPLDAALFNQWVKLDLTVDFTSNMVSASVNNQIPISTMISPSVTVDRKIFRWCYRGEGAGNVARVLVDDVSYSGVAGGPPTISVTRNSVPISSAQIISVSTNTSLASLNLAITVNDPDGNSTSLAATITDLTSQGVLVSEFDNGSAAVPYTLTPATGTFSVSGATHIVTLTANDGQGNSSQFAFTIAVGNGNGGGKKDEGGGCTTDDGAAWLGALAALVCALSVIRRRLSA